MRAAIPAVLVFSACAWAQAPAVAPETPAAELQLKLQRAERMLQDWPNLARYREANASLAAPAPGEQRVVFMGDSLTDGWGRKYG